MKKIFTILAALLFLQCSTDDSIVEEEKNSIDKEIQDNVVVINKENSNLISGGSNIENGIYTFEFENQVPEVKVNDIIVGDEDKGFLRRVLEIERNQNTVTFKTTEATMEDLFYNAEFGLDSGISEENGKTRGVKMNYLAKGVAVVEDGLVYNFTDVSIFQDEIVNFKISDGTLAFKPQFHFKMDYQEGNLNSFLFKTEESQLLLDIEVELGTSQALELGSLEKVLVDYDKYNTFFVAGVPVVVVLNVQLIAKANANIESELICTTGFVNDNLITIGAEYVNEDWKNIYSLNTNVEPKTLNSNGTVNLRESLSIVPEVKVYFYNVMGPYFRPQASLDYELGIATSKDWFSELKASRNYEIGVNANVLGQSLFDYSKSYIESLSLIKAPDTINKISGDEQVGVKNEELKNPLQVQVANSMGKALAHTPVYFSVVRGGGSLSATKVLTNDSGVAEVIWELGEGEEHEVQAKIQKPDGSSIMDENLVFTASLGEISLSGDIDFGEIYVDSEGKETLIITNNATSSIEVTSIETPNGFGVNWQGGIIEAESSKEVVVYFRPEEAQKFEGVLEVKNNLDEENNKILLSGIGLENEYKVVNLDGLSLPGQLELKRNTPKSLKLVNQQGIDLQGFDVSKLSVRNVSNSEVRFQVQPNGVFEGGTGGDYFEIIALTDLEEVETTFDIFYGGEKIKTISALIHAGENGITLNGKFYPFNYVYIDYDFRGEEGSLLAPSRYVHLVYFSPEPVDFENFVELSEGGYVLAVFFIANQQDKLPSGEYELNSFAPEFENPPAFIVPSSSFYIGESEIYFSSIYEETEPNHYNLKKRGYVDVGQDGTSSFFEFHLYNEDEELVTGSFKGELKTFQYPNPEEN